MQHVTGDTPNTAGSTTKLFHPVCNFFSGTGFSNRLLFAGMIKTEKNTGPTKKQPPRSENTVGEAQFISKVNCQFFYLEINSSLKSAKNAH